MLLPGVSRLSSSLSIAPRTAMAPSCFVVELGLVMEIDTARAVVKAIYPTIIVMTVMLLAVSWGVGLF